MNSRKSPSPNQTEA
jgi:hypothetical protein